MFARVNRSFRDLKEGVDRKEGEVFELTPERFADINRKLNAYVSECDAPDADASEACRELGRKLAKPRAKRRAPANKAKGTTAK